MNTFIENIFIVLVLYNERLETSNSIASLEKYIDSNAELLVFDNSPCRQYEEDYFVFNCFNIHYLHDATNPGLSTAYNFALVSAHAKNRHWLLLLDQDTIFSEAFIEELRNLNLQTFKKELVCIIPNVISVDNMTRISPCKLKIGGISRPVKLKSGVLDIPITGINSGTLLNVNYMVQGGGFNTNYSLDMLDHWYFRKLQHDQKRIYLMDCEIHQNLSVLDNFEENVSLSRYRQLLTSEALFIKEEKFLSRSIFKFRLFLRAIKQLTYNDSRYYKSTFMQILK